MYETNTLTINIKNIKETISAAAIFVKVINKSIVVTICQRHIRENHAIRNLATMLAISRSNVDQFPHIRRVINHSFSSIATALLRIPGCQDGFNFDYLIKKLKPYEQSTLFNSCNPDYRLAIRILLLQCWWHHPRVAHHRHCSHTFQTYKRAGHLVLPL